MGCSSDQRVDPVSFAHAAARLGHHRGDGIAPRRVVRGFLVCDGGSVRAVGFDEHEARGIVGLLHDIEGGDAGFLHAGAGAGERGGFEGFDAVGFDADDEHEGRR